MLINFFFALKKARIPVSITELLHLLEILKARLVYADIDEFYYMSRMALVKDERHYDKFDRAFSTYFKGLEDLSSLLASLIPDEYLRREFEKSLTPEELENAVQKGANIGKNLPKAKEHAPRESTYTTECPWLGQTSMSSNVVLRDF